MSENKKFISFFSIATIVCLLFTYIFSVVKIESKCINRTFLVAVFGGLLGSFGVMLLSEIKKYYINKRAAEDSLYFSLYQLYSELIVETKNTDVYLERPDIPVPENLYNSRVPEIRGLIFALQRIDYAPIRKNDISKQWEIFRKNEGPELDNHVNLCSVKLSLAIIQEQQKALEMGKMHYHPTASDHDVKVTLNKMKIHASARAKAIDTLQNAVSVIGKGRYNWEEDKKRIDSLSIGLPSENQELRSFFEDE